MRLTSILRTRSVNPNTMGPIKHHLINAKDTLYFLPENKSWFCGGYRSAAIAAELLRNKKIIALPTDTIYGLAGLAQNDEAIARLYEIKERDESKPLAICLSDVNEIENWAHVDDLPDQLTNALLPGPTTLILKRKDTLNPSLNPGVENVGIRIPARDFVRSVVKMINQPIALTSANKSRTRSTLHPHEFQDLWPELDGIFYEKMNMNNLKSSWRSGSTIVDLSIKGEYQILRKGTGYQTTIRILKRFKLKERPKEKKIKEKTTNEIENENESSTDDDAEAEATA